MLVLCGSCEFYDNRNGGFIFIRIKEELKNAAFLHNTHDNNLPRRLLGSFILPRRGSSNRAVGVPHTFCQQSNGVQVFLSLARHIHITS